MSERNEDKAERVTAEMRVAIRDAHAAMKDMRSLLKELRETRAKWEGKVEGLIEAAVGTMLLTHMQSVSAAVANTGEMINKKMNDRFDRIMAILMGEERGENETMDDLARQVRAAMTDYKQGPVRTSEPPRPYGRRTL
jgi:hypothetical protein